MQSRTQVIILVREDLSVICFDKSLNIIWETSIAQKATNYEKVMRFFKVDQLSISIYPLNIREGEQTPSNDTMSHGLILIGENMAMTHDLTHLADMIKFETGMDMNENANAEHPFMKARSKLEHFSVYALSGSDGHILWSHDGLGAPTEQLSRSLPQHAFSLDIRDLMTKTHHAPGVSDWTIFRQSLVDELPHTWLGPEDSKMRIAHFLRRHTGAGAASQNAKKKAENSPDKKKSSTTKGRRGSALSRRLHLLQEVHTESKLSSAAGSVSLPHSAVEHIENPNVVVLHSKGGLEVLSLRSGAPVTSLALSNTKTYADLDGDGVVDCITVLPDEQSIGRHQEEHSKHAFSSGLWANSQLRHCSVVVTSGLPSQAQLFNGSLCHDLGHGPASQSARIPSKIRYAIPLVLPKPNTAKETSQNDLIIAINTGIVSSYSSAGVLNWQLKGVPTWSFDFVDDHHSQDHQQKPETRNAVVFAFDPDSARATEAGTHNSVYANILITGETSLQLVSREGEFLSAAEIPSPPISRPVIGDFDNDGVTDIVVVTEDAILGYHVQVERAVNGLLVLVMLAALFAAIVFAANIQSVSLVADEPGNNTGAKNRKSGTAAVLRIFRSTDHHLD